jgi:DNA-binding MarR family transcriptional regulator
MTRAADATRLVDRLIKDGYVERANSKQDRRVVLIRATRSGRAVFKRTTTAVKKLHRSQWASLSNTELRQFRRLLVKVLWGGAPSADRHPLASDELD